MNKTWLLFRVYSGWNPTHFVNIHKALQGSMISIKHPGFHGKYPEESPVHINPLQGFLLSQGKMTISLCKELIDPSSTKKFPRQTCIPSARWMPMTRWNEENMGKRPKIGVSLKKTWGAVTSWGPW